MEETATPGPGDKVTVEDLDRLIQDIQHKRAEIEAHEAGLTELNKELARMKGKAVAYLKELGREKYALPGVGTISIVQKWSVSNPKTPEDREAFFAHLKEKGLYESMLSVNAQSLRAWYMREWEAAKENGDGFDFRVPGIAEPTLFEDLGIRKG